MKKIKIAGVQTDIRIADPPHNLVRMEAWLKKTTDAGATLTLFPECTTTGYCFESREEAQAVAEPVDGPTYQAVHAMCVRLGTQVIYGFLEQDNDQLYNTASLVGPRGLIGSYRKTHLPFLGVDRFTTPGDRPLSVISTDDLRIGLNICYDSSFPESARVLALQGADLIALPTNWPPTAGLTPDLIPSARALENHVYYMAINRIGTERGISFVGKSKICDPSGRPLACADHANEAILTAEIDPEWARQKHLVNIPGVHEVHRTEDRRPDLYGPLADPA